MTVVFNHSGHKKLWQWLSENPGKLEHEWPEWKEIRVTTCCSPSDFVEQYWTLCRKYPFEEHTFLEEYHNWCCASLLYKKNPKEDYKQSIITHATNIKNLPLIENIKTK